MKPVALVCIAKNEDHYIQEWLAYYLKIGFDRIYIYENNWRAVSVKHPQAVRVPFDGEGKQNKAYNSFIQRHGHSYSWAAFFDVDEYLVLHKHQTIQQFLSDYDECPSLGINTVLFGNSGLSEVVADDYSLLKRFTMRAAVAETLPRHLVQMHPAVRMGLVPPVNQPIYTPSKRQFRPRTCQSPERDISIAQLNHYFCKTPPEFQQKINRGKTSQVNPANKRTFAEYEPHNRNEVLDTTARDFLYPLSNKDNHADHQ